MELLFSIAFLLSPEHLSLAGKGLGGMGILFLIMLAAAAIFHIGSVLALVQAGQGTATPPILDAARIVTRYLLFAVFGTLVLATVGYEFNEVFVYWFPNLLFSFLLLACCGLFFWLAGDRGTRLLVIVLALAAVVGVLVLSVMAWFPQKPDVLTPVTDKKPLLLLLALPLLMGFDLAEEGGVRAMLLALVAIVLLHSLWGIGILQVVDRERLVSSTVPHMNAARRIMGMEGRMIMGAAMIAATSAGMLALLRGVFVPLVRHRAVGGIWKRLGVAALVCTAPALLMGFGFAGEEITESLLRGVLAAVFTMYVLACILALRRPGNRFFIAMGLAVSLASAAVVIVSSRNVPAALAVLVFAAVAAWMLDHHVLTPSKD